MGEIKSYSGEVIFPYQDVNANDGARTLVSSPPSKQCWISSLTIRSAIVSVDGAMVWICVALNVVL